MAHGVIIDGTVRSIRDGACRADGTVYGIREGAAMVGGTVYAIPFGGGVFVFLEGLDAAIANGVASSGRVIVNDTQYSKDGKYPLKDNNTISVKVSGSADVYLYSDGTLLDSDTSSGSNNVSADFQVFENEYVYVVGIVASGEKYLMVHMFSETKMQAPITVKVTGSSSYCSVQIGTQTIKSAGTYSVMPGEEIVVTASGSSRTVTYEGSTVTTNGAFRHKVLREVTVALSTSKAAITEI